jgi:hypothetical protein
LAFIVIKEGKILKEFLCGYHWAEFRTPEEKQKSQFELRKGKRGIPKVQSYG